MRSLLAGYAGALVNVRFRRSQKVSPRARGLFFGDRRKGLSRVKGHFTLAGQGPQVAAVTHRNRDWSSGNGSPNMGIDPSDPYARLMPFSAPFQGVEIPIYIWYDSYPTHSGEGYEGRVSRVSPDSPYGLASLNLTDIRESDQGWYECKVVFLNRSPNSHKNGTWFHLDVHGEFRFQLIGSVRNET